MHEPVFGGSVWSMQCPMGAETVHDQHQMLDARSRIDLQTCTAQLAAALCQRMEVLACCMCCRGMKVQARDDFVPVGSSTKCTGIRQLLAQQ